jgi:hypothetical protein
MMGRIDKDYKDNLDTSDGNSNELRLRRNPFIVLCAI